MSKNKTLELISQWFSQKLLQVNKPFPKKESEDDRNNGQLVANLDLKSDTIAGLVERPLRIGKAGLPELFPSSLNSVSDNLSDFRVPAFILPHFALGFIESQMQSDNPRWYRLLNGAFFGIGTVCVSASLTLVSVPLAIFLPFIVIVLYLTKGLLQTGYSAHQLKKLAKKADAFNDEITTDTIKLALLLNKKLDHIQTKIGAEIDREKIAPTIGVSLEKLQSSLKKLQAHELARKKLSTVVNNYNKIKKYNFSAIESLWKNIESPKAVQRGLESLKKLVLAQQVLAQTIEETKAEVENDIVTEQAEKFLVSLIGSEEWKKRSETESTKNEWISRVQNNDWKAIQESLVVAKPVVKREGTWQYKRQEKLKEIVKIVKNFNYKLTGVGAEKEILIKQFLKNYLSGFTQLSKTIQDQHIKKINESENKGEALEILLIEAQNENETLQFKNKWQSNGVHKGLLAEMLEQLNKRHKKLNEEIIRLGKIYLFAKSGCHIAETKSKQLVSEDKTKYVSNYSKQCELILKDTFAGKCSLDEATEKLELNKNSLFENLGEEDVKESTSDEEIFINRPLIEKDRSFMDKDTAYELREILTSRSKYVKDFIEETTAFELRGFIVVVYFCGFVGVSLLCTSAILGTLGLATPFVFPIMAYSLLAFVNVVGVYFGFKSSLASVLPTIAYFIKNITDNVLGLETMGKGVSFLVERLDALMKWPVNKVHEWKVKKIEQMFFGENQPNTKTWEHHEISTVLIKENHQETKKSVEEKIKIKLALQELSKIDLNNIIVHDGKALANKLRPLLKTEYSELKKELLDDSVTIKSVVKGFENLTELQNLFPSKYKKKVENLLNCLKEVELEKTKLAVSCAYDFSEKNPIKEQVENFYTRFITKNIKYVSFDQYMESKEIESSKSNSLIKCIGEIQLSVENFSAFCGVIQQCPQLYENPWVIRGLKRFAEKCTDKDDAKIVFKFCDYLTCGGTLLKLQKKLTASNADFASEAFHDVDEVRKKIIEFLTIVDEEKENKEVERTNEIFKNIRQTTSNFFSHHPIYKSNVVELRHLKQTLSREYTQRL